MILALEWLIGRRLSRHA